MGVHRRIISSDRLTGCPDERSAAVSQTEIRILVADDSRNIRKNLKMILEAAGYTVDATGDSEEALARCHQRHYDIAFVDMNMTKIGGLDLVRYIRALSKKTTVVMLSQNGAILRLAKP